MHLGLDLGTSGVKSVLLYAGGTVVGHAAAPLPLSHHAPSIDTPRRLHILAPLRHAVPQTAERSDDHPPHHFTHPIRDCGFYPL